MTEQVEVEQVGVVEPGTQSLISIQFKSGGRSELWYTGFTTKVEGGVVSELGYSLADPSQAIHHISLNQIEMITVKQTKPL